MDLNVAQLVSVKFDWSGSIGVGREMNLAGTLGLSRGEFTVQLTTTDVAYAVVEHLWKFCGSRKGRHLANLIGREHQHR